MPYFVAAVLKANEVFAGMNEFKPHDLLQQMGQADTMVGVADNLHLIDVLGPPHADELRQFLAEIPQALDAAAVAGIRSALSRGLRSQITWEPGYEHELRVWEVSDGAVGLVNLFLSTPNPVETVPA